MCMSDKGTIDEASCIAWACREFGKAPLKDARRTARLVAIAAGLAHDVGIAISNSCGPGASQLVSRLFDRKEVTVESALENHIKETVRRCGKYDLVYAIQDSTSLNYGTHPALKGVGPLSSSSREQGLMMHGVLACSPDGTPLGLLDLNLWARDPKKFGEGKNCQNYPIEEKESYKWINGLQRVEEVLPPEQRVLVIGDRESDIFYLFYHQRRPNTDLLVRSCYNRRIENEEDREERLHIQEAMDKAKILGVYEVEIPRQGKRKPRTAKLSVKSAGLKIKRPDYKTVEKYDHSVEVWCVKVEEINRPDDVKEPLKWTLLTTMKSDTFKKAVKMVKAYCKRWIIEDFHKTLKTGGCDVERLQFENTDRLRPAIAALCVVAWRVLYLSRLSRESPGLPADEVCSDEERVVLSAWIYSLGKRKWKNFRVDTVSDFVLGVAVMGGFHARKCDGHPGVKCIWRGLRKLDDLVEGFRLASMLRSGRS